MIKHYFLIGLVSISLSALDHVDIKGNPNAEVEKRVSGKSNTVYHLITSHFGRVPSDVGLYGKVCSLKEKGFSGVELMKKLAEILNKEFKGSTVFQEELYDLGGKPVSLDCGDIWETQEVAKNVVIMRMTNNRRFWDGFAANAITLDDVQRLLDRYEREKSRKSNN